MASSEQAPGLLFSSTNFGPGAIRGFCKKNVCSVNAKSVKIKAFKFLRTKSWQNKNTILSLDTGIECDEGKDFAIVIGANSETDTKLLYTPCVKMGIGMFRQIVIPMEVLAQMHSFLLFLQSINTTKLKCGDLPPVCIGYTQRILKSSPPSPCTSSKSALS